MNELKSLVVEIKDKVKEYPTKKWKQFKFVHFSPTIDIFKNV
jgi:hypothetical protein